MVDPMEPFEFSTLIRNIKDNLISELNLAHRVLTSEQIAEICEYLKKNTKVVSLDLSGLNNGKLTEKDCISIADMLKKNTKIQYVFLRKLRNFWSKCVMEIIFPALSYNSTLKTLDFGNNGTLHHTDLSIITKVCKEHPTIRHLSLENCLINLNGTQILANALAENMSLLSLNLSNCYKGHPWGGKRSKSYLSQHPDASETYIWYADHPEGERIVTTIFKALETNTNLQHLDLSGNGISEYLLPTLVESLRLNKTLQYLDLSCNKISTEAYEKFLGQLKDHPSLKMIKLSVSEQDELKEQKEQKEFKEQKEGKEDDEVHKSHPMMYLRDLAIKRVKQEKVIQKNNEDLKKMQELLNCKVQISEVVSDTKPESFFDALGSIADLFISTNNRQFMF